MTLSPEDLDAIKIRSHQARTSTAALGELGATAKEFFDEDVPALLAEVDSLNKVVDEEVELRIQAVTQQHEAERELARALVEVERLHAGIAAAWDGGLTEGIVLGDRDIPFNPYRHSEPSKRAWGHLGIGADDE